jgi:hypothetical protein
VAKNGLLDAVVPEPDRPAAAGLHNQETLIDGRCEPLLHDLRRYAGHGVQKASVHLATKAGHGFQHLAAVWR